MMAAVRRARATSAQGLPQPQHLALGSIKIAHAVHAQGNLRPVLQPHRDPRTGKTSTVFSCFNQDQELDSVDFGGLSGNASDRLLQEKITRMDRHCMPEQRQERSWSRLPFHAGERVGVRSVPVLRGGMAGASPQSFFQQLLRIFARRHAADVSLGTCLRCMRRASGEKISPTFSV